MNAKVVCSIGGLTLFVSSLTFGQAAQETSDSQRSAARIGQHYVEQARSRYADSLATARELLKAVNALTSKPSPETHRQAKDAWIRAHSIYSQTEVFRFGNPNVDQWESKVNAWPMDEGFVDYVVAPYVHDPGNPHGKENLIGSPKYILQDDYLAEYQAGTDPKAAPTTTFTNSETNISTGFHVIEFLLWGQDLNETPNSAGKRPYTDFVVGEGGTNGFGRRRCEYINAAARLLVSDLQLMVTDWDPERNLYAATFLELPVEEQMRRILLGLGGLSFGELAGERMKVALLACDQEDEQSCFSDTTHLAIYYNALSIQSVYLGQYESSDGTKLAGPGLSAFVAEANGELDAKIREQLSETMAAASSPI